MNAIPIDVSGLAEKFWWFPHMWRHSQPHKYTNTSHLMAEMMHNLRFAQVNSH